MRKTDRVAKSSGGRVCTSARKVAALRALVKTAIAADAGTKEPSQPKVAHSMPPSAAAPYTRSQGQRASSRNRPAASEATRAPRHRGHLPNAPSKLSGTAAATASAYPEQQPGRQPPRHHRGTTHAPPRNHPRATHGTRPRKENAHRERTAATLLRVVPEPCPSYSVQMRIATPWLGSSTALYGNLPLSWIRKLGLRKAPLTLIRVERKVNNPDRTKRATSP